MKQSNGDSQQRDNRRAETPDHLNGMEDEEDQASSNSGSETFQDDANRRPEPNARTDLENRPPRFPFPNPDSTSEKLHPVTPFQMPLTSFMPSVAFPPMHPFLEFQPPRRPPSPEEFRQRLIQTIEEVLSLLEDDIEGAFRDTNENR